jgi:hypothetical protein
MYVMKRGDFELECIREFAHSGLQLGVHVSREERRERIRMAILGEHKEQMRWRDTQFTYSDMYRHAYNQVLEGGLINPEEAAARRTMWHTASMAEDRADDDESDEGDEEII